MLRLTLGIESGDEVKELMLGKICPASTLSIERSSLLTREHQQSLEDQAERSLVSGYDVSL